MKRVDFNKIISYFSFDGFQGSEINVVRDWKVILAVFVMILTAVILFNGYAFWKYNNEPEREIEVSEITTGIDKEVLRRIINDIEKRELEFNANLIASPPEDPSL